MIAKNKQKQEGIKSKLQSRFNDSKKINKSKKELKVSDSLDLMIAKNKQKKEGIKSK